MLSTKLTRVATCAAAASTCSSSNTAHRVTACLATRSRPSHQRRPSSSKASCPPESSPGSSKPAPATKTVSVVEDKSPPSTGTPQPRSPKRMNKTKRSKTVATGDKPEDHFAGLPAVPGTQHLSQPDLSVSFFFSLHRPLSLKHTVPPVSSVEAFNSIFESRNDVDPWANGNSAEGRPEDVVYALGSLFENLDHGSNEAQDDGVRWEVIQESSSNHAGIKHLDGPPRQKTMDELVAEFRPFNAPPPPEPFIEERNAGTKRKASKTKSKSYEATIIVTEFIARDGSKRYTASSSPIVRVPSSDELASIEEPFSEGNQSRFPHRERRLERSRAFWLRQQERVQDMPRQKHKMFLISVKRQRKLKMKKHKYKKLMKRTRNLRRRQDRA